MSEEPHQAASAPLEGLRAPSSDGSLSLDHLSQAFQALLSGGSDPYAEPSTAAPLVNSDAAEAAQLAAVQQQVDPPEDDRQLTPRAILEAMLFVGLQDNAPLRPDGVAGLLRAVSADEIHDL